MNEYLWAKNNLKLLRAIVAAGNGASEAQIRVQYELIGGLIDSEYEVKPEPVVVSEETIENEPITKTPLKTPKVKKTKSGK